MHLGLVAAPLVCAAMLMMEPPQGMTLSAWRTAAVGVLMATWWITEAIPIPATALLPIVLFPPLGIATIAASTAPYANPVIYLFLGGFLIAMALESCGLHRRMALAVLGVVGTRPAPLILGFMAATAFMSMWVSNSATVVMMLPMATSVIALEQMRDRWRARRVARRVCRAAAARHRLRRQHRRAGDAHRHSTQRAARGLHGRYLRRRDRLHGMDDPRRADRRRGLAGGVAAVDPVALPGGH